MPVKCISLLLKTRNIRGLILILIVTTLIFALYQLTFGSTSGIGPTKLVLLEENAHIHGRVFKTDEAYNTIHNDGEVGPTKHATVTTESKSELTIIPRYHGRFRNASSKFEKEKEPGRCPKIQIFKADFDALDIYPKLEFDAEWIRGREYWNAFFEQRYKSIKKSKKSPTLKVNFVLRFLSLPCNCRCKSCIHNCVATIRSEVKDVWCAVFHVRCRSTCASTNCVHLLHCEACLRQNLWTTYVGESEQQDSNMHQRWGAHHTSLTDKYLNKTYPLATVPAIIQRILDGTEPDPDFILQDPYTHFNYVHTPGDRRYTIVDAGFASTIARKRQESQYKILFGNYQYNQTTNSVPHSHNDPGWLKTFEEYYNLQTRHILDNAVEKLTEFKNMSFLWSEIAFLSKWWEDSHPRKRVLLKNLVKEGRMEIVTGGWVMTDEATVNFYSMIDQLIEGQQWVKTHLNVSPTTSWSVDPFGHGSTFPYVLKKSGINGMVIQRIHYAWKKWLSVHQKSDFQWVQRWDYANKDSIRCHNAPFDIYSIKHSCGPHPQICLNFDFKSIEGEYSENSMVMQPITKHNVKEKAELMLEQYGRTASLFSHNTALISMGDDFRFMKPIEWDQQYTNYMKLFNYINANKEHYKAEVRFGTVADYFEAIGQRTSELPSYSGDFHVYSDIFSEGRPAYWSGYYSTRPFWKKFYRESENNIRGAEILFSFANALSRQKTLDHSSQVLLQSYEELTLARRWLALFAHHDATTGTSKANTMNDYGSKLMESYLLSTKIQINSIETILFGKADSGKLITDYEIEGFGQLPKQIPLSFDSSSGVKKIVLYNNLARTRYHLVKLVINTPHVEVVDPRGEYIQAQVNPILEMAENSMVLSSEAFELTFLANLVPLSLSVFEVRKSTPKGEHNAVLAAVYCKSCESVNKIFEINPVQVGDIQLNNERLQVLFDRSTGLIMSITKVKDGSTVNINMKFGSYTSVNFRSGAYLLMPDVESEQEIPFPSSSPRILIISGPISSELSVFHNPILLSTKIMHDGDHAMLESVTMQNQIDLGQFNGEVYMRFDTDLKTWTKVKPQEPSNSVNNNNVEDSETGSDPSHQPTFYTDQSGFTVEKRVKIPSIRYEGNTYPVNTMTYIQDDSRKLRFSILVDRSHGFCSMENGRLETLVERRTVYDDSRGMGEGVTDNRLTISNYVLLFERLGPVDKVRHTEGNYLNSQPTLSAHHLSQELSYPAFYYLIEEKEGSGPSSGKSDKMDIFPLINQELPCDSHLINLRTMTDSSFQDLNFPGGKALLLVQKIGYLCNPSDEKPGCGNPNPLSLFYPNTTFNGISFKSIVQTDLAGITVKEGRITDLHDIVSEPFEISSLVVTFTK